MAVAEAEAIEIGPRTSFVPTSQHTSVKRSDSDTLNELLFEIPQYGQLTQH